MENEYQTKVMKPETVAKKAPAPKVVKDGDLYQEKGIWKFKIAGQVYQYKTKAQAEAGLLIVNG